MFLRNTLALSESIDPTVGLKAEQDTFSGMNLLPDARLAWRAGDKSPLWGAASRTIRTPTPFDRDAVETLGTTAFLTGNDSFDPEQVDTLEIGYLSQPSQAVTFSVAVFYNVYDNLRTIKPASATESLPLRWDNRMEGSTVGGRVWNTVVETISGFYLLDDRHLEYPAPGGNFTPHSVLAQARWRF